MRRVSGRSTTIAPLWRRLLANLANLGLGLTAVVLSVGLAWLLGWIQRRAGVRLRKTPARSNDSDEGVLDRLQPWVTGVLERWKSALFVSSVISAVAHRNRRTPGARLLRIRRVDASTGGPVTIRSALTRNLIATAWSAIAKRLTEPHRRRSAERMEALQGRLQEIRKQHEDDPEAEREATMKFYKAENVTPLSSCGWMLAAGFVLQVPVPFFAGKETVIDRLAGTVVVVDP